MSANDGGPAFPKDGFYTGLDGNVKGNGFAQGGMSLRDYFAGQALVALVSAPGQHGDAARNSEARAAAWAYSQADAMLAERDR